MGLKDIANKFTPASIKNYWFPVPSQTETKSQPYRQQSAKNFNQYAIPIQLERIRTDISMWRLAMAEAERAYYPYRVRMQRMYQDTILNDHVQACITKRKNLTLLKEFMLCDKAGKENKEALAAINAPWFYDLMNYQLDAIYMGYSLTQFGDFVNGGFPELSVVQRENIVVDSRTKNSRDPYYGSFPYSPGGEHFTNPEAADKNGLKFWQWLIWAPTPSLIGSSSCGFGLLYYVAKNEIYLRNNLSFNADYIELFGQPLRKGTTTKSEEDGTGERARFEQALRSMGSSSYIILDPEDDVEFIKGEGAGRGNEVYDNIEQRLQKGISKVLLGHADAMESTPGKLGNQGKDDDGVGKALRAIETTDVRFLEAIINDQVLPKIIALGVKIPLGLKFKFKNNEEKQELREREDASNLITSNIAVQMKTAGLKMDAKYFEERTGIPCEQIEDDAEVDQEDKIFAKDIKNRINNLHHVH